MNRIMFWDICEPPRSDLAEMCGDVKYQKDKTIIDVTGLSAERGEGKLLERLESLSLIQSKNALVFCFLDSIGNGSGTLKQTPKNYVRQLSGLVCAYPEVTFRFIEDSSSIAKSSFEVVCSQCNANLLKRAAKCHRDDCPECAVNHSKSEAKCHKVDCPQCKADLPKCGAECPRVDCPKCFIGTMNIENEIKYFEVGRRDVFDPDGIRAAIRSGKWKDVDSGEVENIRKTLPSFAARPCAYILEDELDYSELVGYCAYRSGKYRVRPILITQSKINQIMFEGLFTECTGGVLIHAWDISKIDDANKRQTFEFLRTKKIKRMVITGAGTDVVELTNPNEWTDTTGGWLAWKEGEIPNLRGLQKPLEWIHDIRNHGLLPDWTHEMKSLLFWKNRKVLNLEGLPYPWKWIHEIWKNGLLPDWPLTRSVVSTFLDEIPLANNRIHSAKLEAQEMAQQLLNRSRIALKSDEPLLAAIFSLEAIRWLRGNSSTLLLDSVQSLYEAETELELGFGCSGRSSRTEAPEQRAKELKRLMEMLSASHKMPEAQVPEMKERIWTALRRRYLEVGAFEPAESALKYIHDAHSERMGQRGIIHPNRLLFHFPKTLPGRIMLLFLASVLILIIYKAPLIETNPLDPRGWYSPWPCLTFVTPIIVLFALVGLWAHQWPSVALSPVWWAVTVFASISILSAGNLALLSDPSDSQVITQHRGRAYSEAVAWTCGSALAQVLPNKFIHAAQKPIPHLASISFSWRGKTWGADVDPDLNAVENTHLLRTFLWLENVIAGWLSFATGLSTIYRKASRS